MLTINLRQLALLGTSAIVLSGCAFAGGMNAAEKEIASDLSSSKFQPASREVRNNMDTQENFTQAAFWSHEYHLNPADLEAAIKLAAAVRKMGNPGKAIEITQTTRALYPKDPYLTAEYAAALIASERSDEAIVALDDGLRATPGYARLWSLKGAALDQLESYDLARKHYARALQITPNDPNIMSNLGLSYALAGDPATAETWLLRASEQPGAGINIRQNLALVMQLQGKSTEQAYLGAQTASIPAQGQGMAPRNQAPLRGSPHQQQPQTYGGNIQPRLPAPQPTRAPYRSYASSNAAVQSRPQAQQPAQQPTQQQASRYVPAPQPQAQRYAPQSNSQPQAQPSYRSAAPTYSSQQAALQAAPRAASPMQAGPTQYSNGLESRSNFTVIGNAEGAPKSAAEAARAAAAQSGQQGRHMTVPVDTRNVNAEQANILSQIARNVGPRPTQLAAAPRANPEDNFSTQPETLSRQGQPGVLAFQPYGDPNQAYTQNYAPDDTRTRRGAARRR